MEVTLHDIGNEIRTKQPVKMIGEMIYKSYINLFNNLETLKELKNDNTSIMKGDIASKFDNVSYSAETLYGGYIAPGASAALNNFGEFIKKVETFEESLETLTTDCNKEIERVGVDINYDIDIGLEMYDTKKFIHEMNTNQL